MDQANDDNVSKSSYEDELRTAAEIGASAYEKLRYPLPSSDASVFFDDASQARIISSSRWYSTVFSAFRPTSTGQSPYASAPVVYRAYDEAVRRSLPSPKRPGTPSASTAAASASTPSSPASKPSAILGPAPATATPTPRLGQEHKFRPHSLDGKLVDLKKHMHKRDNSISNNNNATGPVADREEATIESRLLAEAEGGGEQSGPSGPNVGEGPSQSVTDLILIIHGIGQGVRDTISQPPRLILSPADSAIRILQLCLRDKSFSSSGEVRSILPPVPQGSRGPDFV